MQAPHCQQKGGVGSNAKARVHCTAATSTMLNGQKALKHAVDSEALMSVHVLMLTLQLAKPARSTIATMAKLVRAWS